MQHFRSILFVCDSSDVAGVIPFDVMWRLLFGITLIRAVSPIANDDASKDNVHISQGTSGLINFDDEGGGVANAFLPSALSSHCLRRQSSATPVSLFVSVFSRRSNFRQREIIRKSWMSKLRNANIVSKSVPSPGHKARSTKFHFSADNTCALFVVAQESCVVPPWYRAHPHECKPVESHMASSTPTSGEMLFWDEQLRNETRRLRAEADRLA